MVVISPPVQHNFFLFFLLQRLVLIFQCNKMAAAAPSIISMFKAGRMGKRKQLAVLYQKAKVFQKPPTDFCLYLTCWNYVLELLTRQVWKSPESICSNCVDVIKFISVCMCVHRLGQGIPTLLSVIRCVCEEEVVHMWRWGGVREEKKEKKKKAIH